MLRLPSAAAHVFRAMIALVAVLQIAGCDKIDAYIDKKIDEKVDARIQAQIAELQARVEKRIGDATSAQTDQFAAIDNRLSALEGQAGLLEYLVEHVHSDSASVTTDGSGYAIAQTPHGPFLVSAKSATPYLDGYKVRLEVGNMTTATMDGAKIHVAWGLQYGDKSKTVAEITSSRQEKDFSTPATFAPGSYSVAEVFLSPAKTEAVKKIDVTLQFDNVELRKPPS